jgi:beta-glucosidase
MSKYYLNQETYAALARQAAAEGCVLLKNENQTLPLQKGDRVAVFGRIADTYYKSGLGSGGLVNTSYVVGILDALRSEKEIAVDEALRDVYTEWAKEHPYDAGKGWGRVPWCQEEMPLSENTVEAAACRNDVALVIVGRTAGEDQDNHKEPGSYYLTEIELDMIRKVAAKFSCMAVILNVGNIIDMSWAEETKTPAVLYAWQGGQEGGNGVCDVLMGRVNPCGKLADTIAARIEDYPSDANFGNEVRNFYQEDIYVGYRYFETFAKDKVHYPFGYGLSYTTFEIAGTPASVSGTEISVKATVTNTGSRAGKEVVQVYVEAPCGTLGKPARVLAGFAKTKELAPGAIEELSITIPKSAFASYDDDGKSGHKSAFVLEEGTYGIYLGSDVRSAKQCGSYEESELRIIEQLEEACAPILAMKRMTRQADGTLGYEDTPLRTVDPYERMKQNMPEEAAYAGEQSYQLGDVYDGKISMDTFLTQLSDEDLICLFRGEGMCSPKVTPGCGGAFGGLTGRLRALGIPAGCCTDGPSGLRLDCGTKAFSLPNGAALASTFNTELVQHLFYMIGLEMRKNRVDILLGPGMNIHRHPLNGRNFEYFSEDPFLTGKMAAAQLMGTEPTGTTLTIKHFATNNQEYMRQQVDAIVSERALREIYLKGFEIAVKEGKARAVMTTYAPMNGIWTSGNYDLVTTILRKQWGFDGFVMTDWWAKGNVEGQDGRTDNRAPMVAAQNDVYMVNADATDMKQDNVLQALNEGRITRGQLLRNAKNILRFLLKSPAMLHELNRISEEELAEMKERDADDIAPEDLVYYDVDENDTIVIDGTSFDTAQGHAEIFGININKFGLYEIELHLSSDLTELAQLPVTVSFDNIFRGSISIQGTGGEAVTRTQELGIAYGTTHFVKLYFGANGLCVKQVVIRLIEEVPMK